MYRKLFLPSPLFPMQGPRARAHSESNPLFNFLTNTATIRQLLMLIGMGGTQNFVHGINCEKIPRYRLFRGTCFMTVLTKVKQTQQSN